VNITTKKYPRNMNEAFGPYAQLHVPRQNNRWCLIGAALCFIVLLALLFVV
jgi:hypothetical protein